MAPLVVEKYPRPKTDSPNSACGYGETHVAPGRTNGPSSCAQGQRSRALAAHRHEHVDVIARQHSAQDVDLVLPADLTENVADTQAQRPGQDLVAVLSRPDDMIAVIVNAVFAGIILHHR